MIDVYIWMPSQTGPWGHAAMYVLDEASGTQRYISYWPRVISCARDNPVSGCRPDANNYDRDCHLEGHPPSHNFSMNFGASDDVSEAGILAGWARIRRDQPRYAALRHNCCTVVANLLLHDGGARALTRRPDPLVVWTPAALYALMRSFPLSVACGERLAILPPPATAGP